MRRNPDIQFASQQEIKAYQESLLAETLQYLQQHSPYYQRMFAEQGIDVTSIRHIEDLACLPVTPRPTYNCITTTFFVYLATKSSTTLRPRGHWGHQSILRSPRATYNAWHTTNTSLSPRPAAHATTSCNSWSP